MRVHRNPLNRRRQRLGVAAALAMAAMSGTAAMAVMAPSGAHAASASPIPSAAYHEMHANCGVTHLLSDDPIGFPGLTGASHNHSFFGNTTTNAASTYSSLLAGRSSCQDTLDTAAYWIPTFYRNDVVLPPSTATVYYKSGVKDYRTVKPFPPNFREIVGSAKTPDEASFLGNWQCAGVSPQNAIPASCAPGSSLIVHLKSASCWDGVLTGTNDSAHVVYPVSGICPADHATPLPMLEAKITYKLDNGNTSGLRYASGGGFTFHYDFLNAWNQARLDYLVGYCINGGRQCNGYGIDSHKP